MPISAEEYAKPHWQNPKYIEQSFIDITFGREYAQRTQKLNKWVKEINVRILDSTADMALHQQLIHHQLRHLSQLSGQKFNYDKLMHADLVIQVLSEADYLTKLNKDGTAHLLKQSICLAQVEINQFDEIEKAMIWIPVERARAHGKLLSCIVEETAQVLGLMNDSESVYPSIFNDHSHDAFLTGLDLILIKLLYLDELKPGMPENQTRQVIRNALARAEFQSLISQADSAVRIDSLEQLINQ
jgi:hypothetical protein